ncbi:MAG: hypothetical protein HFE77_00230 [Clostridiales bacterium]|nr:hypothetical protein [Clostridiales bacterium]
MKLKKRIALLLAAAFLCVGGMTGCKQKNNENNVADAVIVKSENFEITGDMFQYYLATNFLNYCQEYSAYISYIIDLSMPLKNQNCSMSDQEGYTWFDFFADQTIESTTMFLSLAEGAKAEGMTLSEEDKKDLEEQLTEMGEYGKEQGYEDINAFLQKNYGALVTQETVKACYEIHMLANQYFNKLYNSYTFTEDDYSKYAEENNSAIYKADYISLKIEADYEEDASDEEKKTAYAAALAKANEINSAITDEDAFYDLIEQYEREKFTVVSDDTDIASEDQATTITETTLKDRVAQRLTTAAAYNTDGAANSWLFDTARAAGEHKVIESEDLGYCTVYWMVKPFYRQEHKTVNVRHILLYADTYGSEEAAFDKADQLLEEVKGAENVAEAFGQLAGEYSEDPGSQSKGGLYTNVDKGSMVDEFDAWCFAEGRKPGDTGVVKTAYGIHVMYYEGEGLPSWQATADEGLRGESYTADYTALKDKTTIDSDKEKMKEIPDIIEAKEEANQETAGE